MWELFLGIFLFTIFLTFLLAQWEIQIEGKNGWAANLPTWRISNKLTKLLWDDKPFDGYHLWYNLSFIAIVHIPFVAGLPWTLSREFLFLSMLCFGTIFEDIWWFILNPDFGLHKLNKHYAIWHKQWLGPIPVMYIKYFIAAIILVYLSFHFS